MTHHTSSLPFLSWLRSDGRHFQIISQILFLFIGIAYLGWSTDASRIAFAVGGCLLIQGLFVASGAAPLHSLKSAMVTSLGISLLLKANVPVYFLFAAALAIGQKFAFRIQGKHLWNPANFGIVMVILLSGDAWISPGQWGSAPLIIFIILSAGLGVLSKVHRLETGLVFLAALALLEFFRVVVYLGWSPDVWIHKMSNGSIWLFALFMITDPMTTPWRRSVRILWTVVVAAISFYLANFYFINAAPFWVLFFATPLVPFIDKMAGAEAFQWFSSNQNSYTMKKKLLSIVLLLAVICSPRQAQAFCGFYVAKADASLFNNKSEVILVRDGRRNVITMSSDFKGDVRDFAMVVPVPVVLKREEIKVVNRNIFQALDNYSSPRLVEYYDQNPCEPMVYEELSVARSKSMVDASDELLDREVKGNAFVKIEARYQVGEYDILLLSATESTGLKDWLTSNGYKIPEKAEAVLEPYVKSNMKFFVVKVNMDKLRNNGTNYLSPIQISFEHDKFMLPIRLGMANSSGEQDMIVYAFTRSGRVECTNYRTVKVPTDRNIPLFVQAKFGNFYKQLFDKSWRHEGKNAIFLEYAWNVTPYYGVKCDPCVGPPPMQQEFADAGVYWNDQIFFTRMHVRYGREYFPSDLVFQVTPNQEQFQARYILTHPAEGDLSCDEGISYLNDLESRRKVEIDELYALTGKRDVRAGNYIYEFTPQHRPAEKKYEGPLVDPEDDQTLPPSLTFLALSFAFGLIWWLAARVRLPHIQA